MKKQITNSGLACAQALNGRDGDVLSSVGDVHSSWASETSPTLGCSIEISRDIYYWRASEASETLSGLFNRESRIYILYNYYNYYIYSPLPGQLGPLL